MPFYDHILLDSSSWMPPRPAWLSSLACKRDDDDGAAPCWRETWDGDNIATYDRCDGTRVIPADPTDADPDNESTYWIVVGPTQVFIGPRAHMGVRNAVRAAEDRPGRCTCWTTGLRPTGPDDYFYGAPHA